MGMRPLPSHPHLLFHASMIRFKAEIRAIEDKIANKTGSVKDPDILRKKRHKRKMYLRQRGLCCFCDRMMYASAYGTKLKSVKLMATREHVIPRSKGGKSLDNFKLSHWRCNNDRGVVDFDRFRKWCQSDKFKPLLSEAEQEEVRRERKWKKFLELLPERQERYKNDLAFRARVDAFDSRENRITAGKEQP